MATYPPTLEKYIIFDRENLSQHDMNVLREELGTTPCRLCQDRGYIGKLRLKYSKLDWGPIGWYGTKCPNGCVALLRGDYLGPLE